MSLAEYRKIGAGQYTYLDKMKSAKKVQVKPLDTTFNEITADALSKSVEVVEIKTRSKSSDAFVRELKPEKTPKGSFLIGLGASTTDSRNRTFYKSANRDKI